MPISGLVLTVPQGADIALLRQDLARDSRLQVGTPQQQRLPIVTDTGDREEDRRLWAELQARSDVSKIDVVFVSFQDEVPETHVTTTTVLSTGHRGPEAREEEGKP